MWFSESWLVKELSREWVCLRKKNHSCLTPRLLRASRDRAPAPIVERILDEVLAFGKDCSQKDDMTLVVAAVKDEV